MSRSSVLILLVAAGCVSDYEYARVHDNYRREQSINAQNVKLIASLKTRIETLEQEKKALHLEVAKRDELLSAYRKHLEWTRLIPGAEISSEGNLILAGDVLFLPGSHELTPAGKSALLQVAQVLKQEASRISEVRIEGHSDSSPIRKTKDKYDSNMHLSFMRAYAVHGFLLSESGVDASRFSIAAFGEYRPRADEAASNRRVEIRVLPSE